MSAMEEGSPRNWLMDKHVDGVTLRTDGGVRGVSTAADPNAEGPPVLLVLTVHE